MVTSILVRPLGRQWPGISHVLKALVLALLLAGCAPGGDQGGRLFQVPPGATAAQFVGQLLADRTGRVEDLTLDGLGRLQAVVFTSQHSGVIVRTPAGFCQTVNSFDPVYPLRTASGQPSPSTRAVAAIASAFTIPRRRPSAAASAPRIAAMGFMWVVALTCLDAARLPLGSTARRSWS